MGQPRLSTPELSFLTCLVTGAVCLFGYLFKAFGKAIALIGTELPYERAFYDWGGNVLFGLATLIFVASTSGLIWKRVLRRQGSGT